MKDLIIDSIDKGLNFIMSKQDSDGLWRDFYTLAGYGSDWVTAFVIFAIYRIGKHSILSNSIKQLVRRQRYNGGWSFNFSVPTDCDSTAWILLSLSLFNETFPTINKGLAYIKKHQNSVSGGFSTYNKDDNIQQFIRVQDESLYKGWMNSNNEVTSIAIQSLVAHKFSKNCKLIHSGLEYIKKQKKDICIWESYWWKGYAYSTYNSLKSLSVCNAIDSDEISKTNQYLLSNQINDGGWNDTFSTKSETFATAFILLTLLLLPTETTNLRAIINGIKWLLNQQKPDGSWPTVPILRIPFASVQNPNEVKKWQINQVGTNVIIEDRKAIFTTAAAIWALDEAKQKLF